eukprot:NODE_816_length_3944_cov_0.511573.p3 type:complete len:181 gc:universal NODE_816_length_3944_cov_0.511573:721-1263(+)
MSAELDFNQAIELRNTKVAEEQLELFKKRAPSNSYKLQLMDAQTLRISKKYDEAINILKSLIKSYPSNVSAYLEIASCLFDRNEKWLDYMSQVVTTFKGSKEAYSRFYLLLKLDSKSHKKDTLIRFCLEQLHVLDPYNTIWLMDLAAITKDRESQLELYCRAYLVDQSEESIKGIQKVAT